MVFILELARELTDPGVLAGIVAITAAFVAMQMFENRAREARRAVRRDDPRVR